MLTVENARSDARIERSSRKLPVELLVALPAVFVNGPMIWRTPACLGNAPGPEATKLIATYILVAPLSVLLPTVIAVLSSPGRAGLITNDGAHGVTEILYAFAGAFGSNGQNVAGLNASTPCHHIVTGGAILPGVPMSIDPPSVRSRACLIGRNSTHSVRQTCQRLYLPESRG